LRSGRLESSPVPSSGDDEDGESVDIIFGTNTQASRSATASVISSKAPSSYASSSADLTRGVGGAAAASVTFLPESTRRYDRKTMSLVERTLEVLCRD